MRKSLDEGLESKVYVRAEWSRGLLIRKWWMSVGSRAEQGGRRDASQSVQLILVLLPETVTSREKLPAALLVHLPYVRLLQEEQMEVYINTAVSSSSGG